MAKYPVFIFVFLLFLANCAADTFVHRQTGESFNGYATDRKKGSLTQVHAEHRLPQYINLNNYSITRNTLGRKNKVWIFSIKNSLAFIAEAEAFDKAIALAARQGVKFIIIDIDTAGVRLDLARRISNSIEKINNCTTVAFVSGEGFGGAFSTGAIIAMACDKVYMKDGTAIGGGGPYFVRTTEGAESLEQVYGQDVSDKLSSSWLAYCSQLAERRGRAVLLVRAMVEKEVEVVEVKEGDKNFLIEGTQKKSKQELVKIWSKKGSLLRLEASEAVEFGIADAVATSREQLLVTLGADGVTQVRDRRVPKARLNLQRVLRRLERIVSSINEREEQVADILVDLTVIENQLRRLDRGYFRDGYYIPGDEGYPTPYPGVDLLEMGDMLRDRDDLLDDLQRVLRRLVKEYRDAIVLANKHEDFRSRLKSLEEGLTTVETRLKRIPPKRAYGL